MALQTLGSVLQVGPRPNDNSVLTYTGVTIDAVGESLGAVGIVSLSSGPGTSKVLSAAGGGAILFVPGANTFDNAGTTLRIGVQDLSGNIEDGTHDVYGELTGGTHTITPEAVNTIAMGTGSKTIADGDSIAIVIEMTARGGSDSVVVYRGGSAGMLQTHISVDSGSGPSATAAMPHVAIRFDDGTIGWLLGAVPAAANGLAVNVSSVSTPNEYALIMTPLVPFRVVGLSALLLGASGGTDAGTVRLYADPSGTPSVIGTATALSGPRAGAASNTWMGRFSSPVDLVPGTPYAAAFAVTGGTVGIYQLDFGSGNADLRLGTPLGTAWRRGTRSGGSGAFSNDAADLYTLPLIGLLVNGFSDGAGGGGAILARVQTGM